MSLEYMLRQNTRFAEENEIQALCYQVNLSAENTNAGLPVSSDGKHMSIIDVDENVAVVGEPGSGKTRRILIPLILSLASGGHSFIANDEKGELICSTYSTLVKRGYKIVVINFYGGKSSQYNPLYPAAVAWRKDKDECGELTLSIATTLFDTVHCEKDPYWENASKNLFKAMCYICFSLYKPEECTFENLLKTYIESQFLEGGKPALKHYYELHKEDMDSMILTSLQEVISAPHETLGSILSVFSTVIQEMCINSHVNNILSGKAINPEDIVMEKTALFIVSGGPYTKKIESIIVDQIYTRLEHFCKLNKGLSRTVDFVLEEFSSMYIPNVDTKISVCRQKNIKWYLCIQTLIQLQTTYGSDKAGVIMGCIQNLVFLHSSDIYLLDYIEKMSGEYISQYSRRIKPLISKSRLRMLKKGEILIFLNREYPFFTTKLPDKSVYQERLGFTDIDDIECIDVGTKYIVGEKPSFHKYVMEEREKLIEKIIDAEAQKMRLRHQLEEQIAEPKDKNDDSDNAVDNNQIGKNNVVFDFGKLIKKIDEIFENDDIESFSEREELDDEELPFN